MIAKFTGVLYFLINTVFKAFNKVLRLVFFVAVMSACTAALITYFLIHIVGK